MDPVLGMKGVVLKGASYPEIGTSVDSLETRWIVSWERHGESTVTALDVEVDIGHRFGALHLLHLLFRATRGLSRTRLLQGAGLPLLTDDKVPSFIQEILAREASAMFHDGVGRLKTPDPVEVDLLKLLEKVVVWRDEEKSVGVQTVRSVLDPFVEQLEAQGHLDVSKDLAEYLRRTENVRRAGRRVDAGALHGRVEGWIVRVREREL